MLKSFNWSGLMRALHLSSNTGDSGSDSKNSGKAIVYDDPNGITTCVRIPGVEPDAIFEYISIPSNVMKLFPNITDFSEIELSNEFLIEKVQQIRQQENVANYVGEGKSYQLNITFTPPRIVAWWKPVESKELYYRVDKLLKCVKIYTTSKTGEVVYTEFQIERENQCDSLVISKVVIEALSRKDKSIDNYILCCFMTVKSRLQQEQLALLNRLKDVFMDEPNSSATTVNPMKSESTRSSLSVSLLS